MTEELPLFTAPPEGADHNHVHGLTAYGMEQRGPWLVFWAETPRPITNTWDREAVMRQLAQDPEKFKLRPPGPFNKKKDGWRTWWYAYPSHLPSPGL